MAIELTYISFVVDHRGTFRSIIDIAIDSIHIGSRLFSVNHSGICTHARHATLCPGTRRISKQQNTGESAENAGQNMGV